jgi:phosphatidylglycerophosphatase A
MASVREWLAKTVATVMGVGYAPFVPGTWGSAVGAGLYCALRSDIRAYAIVLGAVIAAGWWASGKAEQLLGRHDPGVVVIDEVAGMLIAAVGIAFCPRNLVLSFFLFRLFDTVKPFPAGRLQYVKGGAGIMMDDIVAGIYANVTLQAALKLAAFTGV